MLLYENQFYKCYPITLSELMQRDVPFYSFALGLDLALAYDYRLWIRQILFGLDTGRPEINRLHTILFLNRNYMMLPNPIYSSSIRKFTNNDGQGRVLFFSTYPGFHYKFSSESQQISLKTPPEYVTLYIYRLCNGLCML